ncbi:hypothetical protein DL766_002167 [Monosporascus sp. MC13-8B]|nr:hypothetical protein DL763_004986 [Monosporascus cannonballus]RYP36118.1 hypothetical protein DL766_002167 [Monosporascus sp. MC13-8B]
MAESITPISIRGRYLWKGEDRFIINGVVYQAHKDTGRGSRLSQDPLTDERLEKLERSIPLLKELGINTLFVPYVNADKNHDAAMEMLAEAGIYVLSCLLNHSEMKHMRKVRMESSEVTQGMLQLFRRVDCLAAYRNTLGLFVAEEFIDSARDTAAAPVVRALTRVVKRYMALAAQVAGRRVLPVGYKAADIKEFIRLQYEYFAAGDEAEAIDFYAFNCYDWVGKSSMSISGYDLLLRTFRDAHIPVFFSEYGANAGLGARLFQETRSILSRDMTDTFSGGIVYEFFEGSNRYGLVRESEEDGSLERLRNFKNLRASVQACEHMQHVTAPSTAADGEKNAAAPRKPEMPALSDSWRAKPEIPECPLDWDEAKNQIEDAEWVDVARDILDLQIEELAESSVWGKFRLDSTGLRTE